MRAETWMDRTPVPQKTPLQLAQDDMRYWSERIKTLTTDLTVAQQEFSLAVGRVNKEDSAERSKPR